MLIQSCRFPFLSCRKRARAGPLVAAACCAASNDYTEAKNKAVDLSFLSCRIHMRAGPLVAAAAACCAAFNAELTEAENKAADFLFCPAEYARARGPPGSCSGCLLRCLQCFYRSWKFISYLCSCRIHARAGPLVAEAAEGVSQVKCKVSGS